MTTDQEKRAPSDVSRRGTNAFIGGIAGVVLIGVMISAVSPASDGMPVIVGALIAGVVGAVIGWALPSAS